MIKVGGIMIVNIRELGLTKAEALRKLYNSAKPQGMGFLHYEPKPMTIEEAEDVIQFLKDEDWPIKFDYHKGRVMKVDLSNDSVELQWYDRDNGENSGLEALTHPA